MFTYKLQHYFFGDFIKKKHKSQSKIISRPFKDLIFNSKLKEIEVRFHVGKKMMSPMSSLGGIHYI